MASVLKSPKITKRAVDAFKPAECERAVWDDDIPGFGVRVHPSGAKAYLVNYRAGNGGRKAPNKRVVVGRAGQITPAQARRLAQELPGASGDGTTECPRSSVEQGVLAIQSNRPDEVLDAVGIHLDASVLEENPQAAPVPGDVC